MAAEDAISRLVTPLVVISACGLLLLGLYARLSALVARIRGFDSESFQIVTMLASHRARKDAAAEQLACKRLRSIRKQTKLVLRRARRLRRAIVCYEITILLMLVSGVLIALTLVNADIFAPIALVALVLGFVFIGAGVITAVLEMNLALGPVELEFMEVGMYGKPDDFSGASGAADSMSTLGGGSIPEGYAVVPISRGGTIGRAPGGRHGGHGANDDVAASLRIYIPDEAEEVGDGMSG